MWQYSIFRLLIIWIHGCKWCVILAYTLKTDEITTPCGKKSDLFLPPIPLLNTNVKLLYLWHNNFSKKPSFNFYSSIKAIKFSEPIVHLCLRKRKITKHWKVLGKLWICSQIAELPFDRKKKKKKKNHLSSRPWLSKWKRYESANLQADSLYLRTAIVSGSLLSLKQTGISPRPVQPLGFQSRIL